MVRRSGRLSFIGLGLHDETGITLAGLDRIRSADVVFAEFYTSKLSEGALERLSAMTNKEIIALGREEVEDGKRILKEADEKKVALLVAGDPMTATTHIDLRLRAHKASIDTEVIHGSSALTAVPGLLGLQHYKFGRTTTLPFPQEGYSPTSPYDMIVENLERGLHTLVLLDIDAENSRYMSANEGLHLLQEMERRMGKGAAKDDSLVCVVARAGSPDSVVAAGPLTKLMAMDFGGPLHSIVVPGRLHFMEEESLGQWTNGKDD